MTFRVAFDFSNDGGRTWSSTSTDVPDKYRNNIVAYLRIHFSGAIFRNVRPV